jgi:hypothetical protein
MELENNIKLTEGRIFFGDNDVTSWTEMELHPCLAGVHRWAWLIDGTVACGYCETRLY